MKRDLKRLGSELFDVLVIGGGISGAAIAWDCALRGLKAGLIDKRDFGGATSAATGKLIHGGLRYLKNFQLRVVRESLRERRIMEVIASHQVHPLPFVIPTYSTKEAVMLKAGMLLYDMLGYDKRRLDDPSKRIPSHKRISTGETLELFPELPKDGLKGGVLYYDCQMVCPERLTFDFVQSAVDQGACVANWAEVTGFVMADKRIRAVRVRDETTGEELEIQARQFVNATGCWADHLLGKLQSGQEPSRLVRSKGIHVLFKSIHSTHALGMITKTKRHVYMLPWRGLTLAGTTDTPFEDDPDNFAVTSKEIDEFIDELNGCYPALGATVDDVLTSYGGIRPLADQDGSKDSYRASRRHEVADHAKDGLATNLVSALGGKYTTSRKFAEQVVNTVLHKLGVKPLACRTAATPLVTNPTESVATLKERCSSKYPDLSGDLVQMFPTHYGSAWEKPLKAGKENPSLMEPVWENAPEIGAQIRYAAENECAVHLEDATFRRTGLCTVGRPDREALQRCASIMGDVLEWSEERCEEEVTRTLELIR